MGSPTRKTSDVRWDRNPSREQQRDKPVLSARGVLKLIDKQVTEVAADGEEAIGRMFQHFNGSERDLCEVDDILFGEDDVEFSDRLAEHSEQVAQRCPLFFGVAVGREPAKSSQCSEQIGPVR